MRGFAVPRIEKLGHDFHLGAEEISRNLASF
jgi:hypothetical protein